MINAFFSRRPVSGFRTRPCRSADVCASQKLPIFLENSAPDTIIYIGAGDRTTTELANRDWDTPAAERLATLVARSAAGVSKDRLARTLGLPPEILDELLRALTATGQVVMLKVGGRTVYKAAG